MRLQFSNDLVDIILGFGSNGHVINEDRNDDSGVISFVNPDTVLASDSLEPHGVKNCIEFLAL